MKKEENLFVLDQRVLLSAKQSIVSLKEVIKSFEDDLESGELLDKIFTIINIVSMNPLWQQSQKIIKEGIQIGVQIGLGNIKGAIAETYLPDEGFINNGSPLSSQPSSKEQIENEEKRKKLKDFVTEAVEEFFITAKEMKDEKEEEKDKKINH